MLVNVSRKDVFWGYFAQFFSIGSGIITLPLVLHMLSEEEIGMNYLMLTLGSLVALFDFGFWSMAIGVAFFVGQNPLISSNATASILEKFPTMAGTANSLMGSVRFGVGAVMGSLVASFKMETAAPMLYTMTACVVISALSYYFLTYRNER